MSGMRKSNFELLRLICMFMVLVLHTNFLSIGAPVYGETSNVEFFVRNLIEVVPFIAVNVFILISGYFSIRPSVKSVANLLFCCFFYSVGIRLGYILLPKEGGASLFDFWSSFLFISNSVWFVADYLMLMIFAPMLNAFVEKNSKRTCLGTLVLMLIFAFYFGLFKGKLVEYISGFSFVTFILLYMIGRVLAQNREWIQTHIKPYMVLVGYIIGVLGFYVMVIIAGYKGHVFYYYLDHLGTSRIFTYTSPFVILSAVCFFWLFAQKEFFSNRVNKLAKSTFAILLIHSNPVAIIFYSRYFRFLYESLSFPLYLLAMVGSCIAFFALSIMIDQVRLFIYNHGVFSCVERIEKNLFFNNETV